MYYSMCVTYVTLPWKDSTDSAEGRLASSKSWKRGLLGRFCFCSGSLTFWSSHFDGVTSEVNCEQRQEIEAKRWRIRQEAEWLPALFLPRGVQEWRRATWSRLFARTEMVNWCPWPTSNLTLGDLAALFGSSCVDAARKLVLFRNLSIQVKANINQR